MKEITLENLLKSEELISDYTADMDAVLRETSNTADTLNRVAGFVFHSDEDNDLVLDELCQIERWYHEENTGCLKVACINYFKALVWLVKNTTICDQVAAKFHDTLKFNVERATEKLLAEVQDYDSCNILDYEESKLL